MIEILTVVAILGIIMTAVVPQIGILQSGKRNLKIFTTIITKVFDDSYLNGKTNYLAVHLSDTKKDQIELGNKIFSRKNGLSVLNIFNNQFIENKRNIFKFRDFPNSFLVEEVVLSTGEKIALGSVIIPFHADGSSDNVIIHVKIDGSQKYSIKLNKYMKEPIVVPEYITFSDFYN
jgi:hypothetical protein